MSNDPENLPPTQAESSTANVQQVASTETRQLSGPAFRVAVLLGLGALVWQAWWHYSTDRMASLFRPDASATRLIDRMMDYAAVSESASAPERLLQWIQNYSPFRAPEDAIKICGETIEHLRSAGFASETQDDMRRLEAVLLGETGRTNEMANVLAGLEASRNSNVVRLLRVAYFHEPVGLPSISSFAGDDELASLWARDALAIRLAGVLGRQNDLDAAVYRHRSRAKPALVRGQTLSLLYLAIMGAGLIWMGWSAKRFGFRPTVSVAVVPPPWQAADAIGVLFFIEVMSAACWLLVPELPLPFFQMVNYYCYHLLPGIGATFVIHQVLIRPRQLRFLEHFGLSSGKRVLGPVVGGGIALFALNLVGSMGLMSLIRSAGLDSPWSESFSEYLVYGTTGQRWMTLLEMAVLGPFFEELTMRGVLFTTLRGRFGFLVSALISSAVFAGLHFYSLAGFVTVMWFGFAAAFIYERTRNLLACMIGHFLANVFLGWFQIVSLG